MKKTVFLLLSMILLFASCERDYRPHDPSWPDNPSQQISFALSLVSLSATTVEISWGEEGENWIVKVYTDALCTQEFASVQTSKTTAKIETLEEKTDYWIVVLGETTGLKSYPLAITTPAAKEVIPPLLLSVEQIFWSNLKINWVTVTSASQDEVVSFDVLVDGQVVASLSADERSYELGGFIPGTTHSIDVLAEYEDGGQSSSSAKEVTFGYVRGVTSNVSPTSLCVEFEGKGGAIVDNFTSCYLVQLSTSEGFSDPFFSEYVVDGQLITNSSAYIGQYSASGSRGKTRVTIGNLTPDTDYYFRVKCEESRTLTGYYNNAAGVTYTLTSPNGTSEFSLPVKFHTAASHKASAKEVLYEGFDGFSIMADMINSAPGTVPCLGRKWEASTNNFTASSLASCTRWAFMPVRESLGETQISHIDFAATAGASTEAKALATQTSRTAYMVKETSPAIASWEVSNGFWVYQGYVGFGYGANNGFICTPALDSPLLGATEQECVVSFKAVASQEYTPSLSLYRHDGTEWSVVGNIAEVSHASGSLTGGYEYSWADYTFSVNLKTGDRIAVSKVGKANGQIFVDEIKIELK